MNTIEEQIREFARALDRTPARPVSNHSATGWLWRPGPRLVGTLAAATLAVGGVVAVGVAMTSTGGSPTAANDAAPTETSAITTPSPVVPVAPVASVAGTDCPARVVPSVVGMSESSAVQALYGAGLVPAVVRDVVPDGDNAVASQSLAPQTSAAAGTIVEIHVAVGPEPGSATTTTVVPFVPEVASTDPCPPLGQVAVPPMIGLSEGQALLLLGEHGLTAAVISVVVADGSPDIGNVIEQTPVAGATTPVGASVRLVVAIPAQDDGGLG